MLTVLVRTPERLKSNPPYISDCRRSSGSCGGPVAVAGVSVSVREEWGLPELVVVLPGRGVERLSLVADNGSLRW